MKNKEMKNPAPVELNDDALDTASGGITTTVPRTVEEARLMQLIQQNPNLTVEELLALYAETYGTTINAGNPENSNVLRSIARSQ